MVHGLTSMVLPAGILTSATVKQVGFILCTATADGAILRVSFKTFDIKNTNWATLSKHSTNGYYDIGTECHEKRIRHVQKEVRCWLIIKASIKDISVVI